MTTDAIIDGAMAEAQAADVETKVNENAEAEAQETEQPQDEEVAEKEGDDESENEEGDDVEESLEKLKKGNKKKLNYIRNLKERLKSVQSEYEKLKSEKIEPKQINEDEYNGTYGELIEERTLEKAMAMLGQKQQQEKLNQLESQQQQILAEQTEAMKLDAVEYGKQSADFAKVAQSNAARFEVLPPEIHNMFFELEDPLLAAYALAKEGKIEQLAFMSPYMAAAELMQAQQRGQRYLQETSKKQVSNAPAPVQGVRGTGKAAPSRLNEKSPDDLYKWIQS